MFFHSEKGAPMAKVIGIDLGTTNSVVSVMEGGDPVVIPNAESGLYNVWVGTYGSEGGPATLKISELDPR